MEQFAPKSWNGASMDQTKEQEQAYLSLCQHEKIIAPKKAKF